MLRKKQGLAHEVGKLSEQELRELVMINAYKLAVARNQIDALIEILIKKKITTYEDVWKLTQARFHDEEPTTKKAKKRG